MNNSNNTSTERIAHNYTEDVPVSEGDHCAAVGSAETISVVTAEAEQSRHSGVDA